MILIDTSVWIDHFRQADNEVIRIIEEDSLLCHPAVIGELALGSLKDRAGVIDFLQRHEEVTLATHDEVMAMIGRYKIFSMGIGYMDAHLLASVLIDRTARLWTKDRRLQAAAVQVGALLHLPS